MFTRGMSTWVEERVEEDGVIILFPIDYNLKNT